MIIKICSRCKIEKESNKEHFGTDKKGSGGLSSRCRDCKREIDRVYSRKYREDNPDWKQEDNKKSISKQKTLIDEYYKKYPERVIAKNLVNNRVRSGKLKRGNCVLCGNPRSVGHHEDYNKPLEVIWLCQKHHKRLDR